MQDEVLVPVNSDSDLVTARAQSRALAQRLGFRPPDPTMIATAVSELARNLVMHAGSGEIAMRPLREERRYGLLVAVRDAGPGIADVEAALQDGYATAGGLGLGLPGARRLMDEFQIESELGGGTRITMVKWRVRDDLERLRERRESG